MADNIEHQDKGELVANCNRSSFHGQWAKGKYRWWIQ